MIVTIELKYGPMRECVVYQHQMQENIDKLKEAMKHCPSHLHISLMDTTSILEGIQKNLPAAIEKR